MYHATQRVIRRFGFDLQRLPDRTDPPRAATFYRPHSTCQIPNLGFLYELFLGARPNGVFVEVGAYDGISFSNTSCLAEVGWQGLLIEPVPGFAQQCRERYADNARVSVVECAAGSAAGSITLMVGKSLTTANEALAREYLNVAWSQPFAESMTPVEVTQARLDDILVDQGVAPGFDVLVVDVEGFEAEVFAGFSIDRWHPQMMIVELADTHPDLTTTRESDAELARSITSAGYGIVFKDSINTVFVRR